MSDPQQFPPAPGAAQSPQASAPVSAQSGYPSAQTGSPGGGPSRRDATGLSRVALMLALVTVAIGVLGTILRSVLFALLPQLNLGIGVFTGFNTAMQVVLFLAYVVTLILGLLSVRGGRLLWAGIAIGVGGAGTIEVLAGFLSTMIMSLAR